MGEIRKFRLKLTLKNHFAAQTITRSLKLAPCSPQPSRIAKPRRLPRSTLTATRDVFVFELDVSTFLWPMNTTPRWIAFAAGILGFIGIALGAFGAHALKETLTLNASVTTWQKAVLYHLAHSVALLSIARWPVADTKTILWAARCWTLGVVLFSGSLYWLSLGGPKFLGPITPIGGLAFLIGWALIAFNALQSPKA